MEIADLDVENDATAQSSAVTDVEDNVTSQFSAVSEVDDSDFDAESRDVIEAESTL